MTLLKKRAAGAQQLHAALAETDPTSIDLILLDRAGFQPAFRLPPLPNAPDFAPRPAATPASRASRKATATPV